MRLTVTIRHGDCREVLKTLPDESVHCVVTSPPYWGAQRDYGHVGQLGMELTPETFAGSLVEIFEEVRRVLRPDGVLWLNLGDSYAASGKGGGGSLMAKRGGKWDHRKHLKGWRSPPPGYKPKDLVGVPWLVANRLRLSGWYLRRDIVWDKSAATEPARADRPAGSHEMLFLFAKSQRYHFDNSALPHGTVWRISPQGYEGHSAAFPTALIEPCILSTCPPGGTVLDPFGGAGTTGMVADRNGRDAILIELNPDFAALAERRINHDAGMFAEVSALSSQDRT